MRDVLAIAIAIVASICINYSLYLQKKAVDVLPTVKLRLSWDTIESFITNIPWLSAQAFNVSGFALYMVALAFAPVSIVEPIIAAGVALLAYLAIKNLGEKPRRVDLYAIGATIFGVILLGVSLAEGLPKDKLHDPIELWAFAGGIMLLSVVIPLILRGRGESSEAAGLGISAGLIMGIAAVFSRLLMGNFGHQWYIWLIACAATYTPGFVILQAALQRGMAVVVVPPYNGLMEFVPILVGTIALDEKFPKSPALTAIRIVSFVLILVGTVVLSRRAEETGVVPAPVTGEALPDLPAT
jgi:uncharacterized membrane protein